MAENRNDDNEKNADEKDYAGWRRILLTVEVHAECLKCDKIFQRVIGKSPRFLSQPCPHCYNNNPAAIKNLRQKTTAEEEALDSDDEEMPPPPPPLEIVELDYDSDDHEKVENLPTARKAAEKSQTDKMCTDE